MRNASDIFNLKEPKDGDTNGTEMFSVNGACQLTKLSRRRNLHAGSSSFEYGSTSSHKHSEDLPEVHKGTGDSHKPMEDNLEDIKEEFGELQLEGQESARSDDMIFNDNYELYNEKITPNKKTPMSSTQSSPTKKNSPVFRKLTAKKDETVAESAMARNPLTGAGVEVETHRKSKKGPLKPPKWTW